MIHLNNYQLPAANSLLEHYKTLENVIITAQTEPTIWYRKGLHDTCGLCGNIQELIKGKDNSTYQLASYVLRTVTTSWEHYSGRLLYPVPHPGTLDCTHEQSNIDNAVKAYCELPLYTGAYGELRLSLLRYWIAELQDAINKHAI